MRTEREELENIEGSERSPVLSAPLTVASVYPRNNYQVYAWYALSYLMMGAGNVGRLETHSIAKRV